MLIVRYFESFGRMGSIDRTFATNHQSLRILKCWGEFYQHDVLGKHSEVTSTFDDSTLTVLTEDKDFIDKAIQYKLVGDWFPRRVFEQMAEYLYDDASRFERLVGDGKLAADEVAALVAEFSLEESWKRFRV